MNQAENMSFNNILFGNIPTPFDATLISRSAVNG